MAITSVSHAPHTYTPAWGPIVWTVLSSSNDTTNFKYVFDIYQIGGTGGTGTDLQIGRIKQRPNPTGYASIDVSTVIQPYLSPANAVFEIDKIAGATATFAQTSNLIGGFYMKVGEEINGTIYTGLTGATAGDPSYLAYSRTGKYVRAFAGAQNVIDAQNHDVTGPTSNGSNQAEYGNYYPYVMGYTAVSTSSGKFLTSALGTTGNDTYKLRAEDSHTLTYLNRSLNDVIDYDTPSFLMIQVASGASSYLINRPITIGNGAGPRSSTSVAIGATAWSTPQQELTQVAVGPSELGLTGNPAWYNVSLAMWSGVSHALIGAYVSETKHFTVYDDCQGQFPSIRFSWLNKFGGRDYFNFDKFYEREYNATSQNYFKDPNQWSATAWSLQPWKTGNFVYNKKIERSINVTSDWIDEDTMEHLKGLFESPNVLVYMPNETYPQTCLISNKSFIQKLLLTQKMYNLEFSFDLSFDDRVQNT